MKILSPSEYNALCDRLSPPTKSYLNIPLAFVIGGLICTLGQFLTNWYTSFGMSATAASTYTSVSLVLLSALLTGLKLYDKIARWGGAGTLVPITGFANAMVSSALEFKSEGLILGLGGKMFSIAGPVIVYGSAAAAAMGLIIYLFGLY